jgi:hypothetical protein
LLKPNVLGPHDNKLGSLFEEPWCMAKMMCMFKNIGSIMPETPAEAEGVRHKIYNLARELLKQPNDGTKESIHGPVHPFDEVLRELGVSSEVEAMLRRFFVLNHKDRPTAEVLLKSYELEALQALAQRKAKE